MKLERTLGQCVGAHHGPTLIVTGAIHGNEPAGAIAATRVCAALRPARVRGEVLVLGGNLAAAAIDQRGVEVDLNRLWTPALVAALRAADPRKDRPEQREQRALLAAFDAARARARGPIIGLDLHTTSGGGPPFSVAGDTLRNLALAMALPIPLILGLEESLDGTLLQYFGTRGEACMTVETGQHADPAAVGLHEAVIWLTLVASGVLAPDAVPDRERYVAALREAAGRVPRTMELMYRHPIDARSDFAMRPGYRGFQPVKKGEVLATERGEPVRAPVGGRILMPLYQPQGSDGFFIVKDLGPISRAASRTLRALQAHALLPWLPGLARSPDQRNVLHVRRKHARVIRAAELLGYRRRREQHGVETLSRSGEFSEP